MAMNMICYFLFKKKNIQGLLNVILFKISFLKVNTSSLFANLVFSVFNELSLLFITIV